MHFTAITVEVREQGMKPLKPVLGQARKRVAVGMLVLLIIIIGALQAAGLLSRLDNFALDLTQRLVRSWSPRPG